MISIQQLRKKIKKNQVFGICFYLVQSKGGKNWQILILITWSIDCKGNALFLKNKNKNN